MQTERDWGDKLHIQDDQGQHHHASLLFESDTKILCWHLLDWSLMMVLEQYTDLNFDSLICFDGEAPDAEEDEIEVAWQPLKELKDCLSGLVERLSQQEDIYEALEAKRQETGLVAWDGSTFEDPYFAEGGFYQDLTDLLKLLEELQAKGVEAVRLYIT